MKLTKETSKLTLYFNGIDIDVKVYKSTFIVSNYLHDERFLDLVDEINDFYNFKLIKQPSRFGIRHEIHFDDESNLFMFLIIYSQGN